MPLLMRATLQSLQHQHGAEAMSKTIGTGEMADCC